MEMHLVYTYLAHLPPTVDVIVLPTLISGGALSVDNGPLVVLVPVNDAATAGRTARGCCKR